MNLLIYDSGLFTHVAQAMVRHFDRVMYWAEWKRMMPKGAQRYIGEGLPGVERVVDLWDAIDEADLILFTDVGTGDLQDYLRRQGKIVWGPGHGESLELDREGLKDIMKQVGLPSPSFASIVGIPALREYLKDKADLFLKVSTMRGDWETTHHELPSLTGPILDCESSSLGPLQRRMRFLVESPIPDATEIGYDGWCIDGQFPQTNILTGIEIKDCGYAGAITEHYRELPEQVRFVNERLAPVFKYFGYRGFWSDEIRIPSDGTPYLIDPTCRCGSPPSQLFVEMYANWQDILFNGAQGIVIEPKVVKPYGVMAVIYAEESENWIPLEYDQADAQWIKLRHEMIDENGTHWICPQEVHFGQVGYVVGIGDTLLEAMENVVKASRSIKGPVTIKLGAMGKAIEEIEKAEKLGMKFGRKPLPTMAQIHKVIS